MAVAGCMAKQGGSPGAAQPKPSGGGLGGLLGGLLGGRSAGTGSAKAGASGLASMLDLDGDGNPLDDILRMGRQGEGLTARRAGGRGRAASIDRGVRT